jgi:EmrB/QacA subfamily drug resistance transporter
MADPAPPDAPPGPPARRKWWVLLSVAFGAFMAPLDSSIVNTVLPLIAQDFRVDVLQIEWVVLAYLLTLCSLLLVGGRLGDLLDDKRLYMAGFALFTLSSALCGLAGGVAPMVGGRILQALGGALMIANGPAILTRAFPASQRGRALGIQSSVVYIGLTVGPGLGGFIASALGWRWVFYLNVPIGIGAIVVAQVVLAPGRRTPPAARFDLLGPVWFVGTLVSLVLALTRGAALGWSAPQVRLAAVLALVGAGLFVWTELRRPHPFFDLRLFRDRLFAAAIASAMMNYMASNTTAFLTPFLLIQGLGQSPDHAGSLLMATPVIMAVVAPVSGWLSDRIGSRLPTVTGMVCLALGMLLMSRLDPAASSLAILVRLGLVGLGVGLFTSPNNSAIMGAVSHAHQGLASGLVATARSLGMVLGVSVIGSLFGAELQRLLAAGGGETGAVMAAYRHAISIGAAVAAAGALTSLVRGRHPRSPA